MKSIFTKLSTLLLCGAVALVGCTDYSEDIQAVDKNVNDLKTEFEGYKTSTAATIAELQSAIDALEAAQEEMAAEYAKKSELETAVTTLQNLVNEKAEALQAALTDAAGKIAALEAGKADKTEVAALQEQVTKAIEDANAAIKALEAAKADKAELELVKADVASLIEGYTQMIEALQNITSTLTTVQSDLDIVEEDVEALKTAAAEAVYAITNLQASVDALSARVESLEKDLASAKQEIAQHTEALTNLAYGLEAETVAREEADLALQQAVMLLNEGLTNITFAYNAHIEEMEAYKENLAKEMDDLRAQDSALANSILSYYNESLAAVESAMTVLREEQAAAIAALKAEIVAAWEKEKAAIHTMIYDIQTTLQNWCQENSDAIEALQAQDGALAKIIIDNYETLVALIAEGDSELKTYTDEQIVLLYNTVMDWLKTLNIVIEENDAALLEKITKNYTELSETIAKNFDILAEQIKTLRSDLETAINGVDAKVEKLLERVQSLVYVPDFDDHKASIYFAQIYRTDVYLSRQSIIRYRVNAKAGESAEKAAADLAAAWKTDPTILSFELEQVATTRSAEAALKIAKVEAKGEDLFVYAVAKNFDVKFYSSKKNMYSAALVLSDGNNNISSNYTNLCAAGKQTVTPVVINAEGKEITNAVANPELLPYDGDPAEVVVLKGHRLGFKIDHDMNAYLTADDMIAAGYDITVERRVVASQAGKGMNDHSSNEGKNGVVRQVGNFGIEERPFISANVESDTYVTLYNEVKKEEYKALKEKNENVLDLTFNYFVNGVKVSTYASVVMCNRLVTVDLGAVEVPWTLKLANDLYNGKPYAGDIVIKDFPYNLATAADKSLEGYSLNAILHTGTPTKTRGGDYDIQMSVDDKKSTLNFTLRGNYAFAPVTDVDGWNNHTVQWVNDFDDLTITVKAAIKLGKLPKPFEAEDKALEFKLHTAGISNVHAQSKIVETMFAKYRDLIGIEKDDDAKKFFSEVLQRSAYIDGNVNGFDLQTSWQLTTPIYKFEPLNLYIHSSQFNTKGDQAIYVEQNDANTLVDFKFNFGGKVVLPVDALIYSMEDYVNYDAEQKRYEVQVDGDVVGTKYTIDKADLGKYFYVKEQADYGVERLANTEVQFVINTKNAPAPDNAAVTVSKDATSGILVLSEGKAVISDWTNRDEFGNPRFGENEIDVTANLYVNGFLVDSKPVTLYTVDPLEFTKLPTIMECDDTEEGVDFVVVRKPGANATVYTHQVLSLTSIEEEDNLIDVTTEDPTQVFAKSKADQIYDAKFVVKKGDEYVADPTINCSLVKVYTVAEDGSHVIYPGTKYIFNNGVITLIADDGLLNQPIYAEVEYVLQHAFHVGDYVKQVVKVKFCPHNAL